MAETVRLGKVSAVSVRERSLVCFRKVMHNPNIAY